jgi:hypothetical protein
MQRNYISILAQALVYLLTGTFLYTFIFPETGEPYLAAQIIGGIFIVISFIMLASIFSDRLLTFAEGLDNIFLSGLLIASLPVLVTDIVKNIGKPLSYILIIWLLLLIPALIYRVIRQQIALGRIVGSRRASMMALSALAFIFSIIAATSILLNITFVFNPNLWLAFSVIVISIAFILEFWNGAIIRKK